MARQEASRTAFRLRLPSRETLKELTVIGLCLTTPTAVAIGVNSIRERAARNRAAAAAEQLADQFSVTFAFGDYTAGDTCVRNPVVVREGDVMYAGMLLDPPERGEGGRPSIQVTQVGMLPPDAEVMTDTMRWDGLRYSVYGMPIGALCPPPDVQALPTGR